MEWTKVRTAVQRSLLFALLVSIPPWLVSCGTPPAVKSQVMDGKVYGLTEGAFRERWWQYYQRGLSFAEGHFWQQAEGDFRAALELRRQDQRRKKTYGMHFLDYFPHRELGIVLFHQGRYEEAADHLERSLATEKSAKAEFYLDCVRKSVVLREARDQDPPDLLLHAPPADFVTNGLSLTVDGVAGDDTFVQSLGVNGRPVRIDLAAARVPFHVEVDLGEGENILHLEATDITGKSTVLERRILADWEGPTIALDEFAPLAPSRNRTRKLRVMITDEGGIQEVKIDGRETSCAGRREVFLDVPASVMMSGTPWVIEAVDGAGNRTVAELPLSPSNAASVPLVLLASNSLSGLILAGNASSSTGTSLPLIEVKNWSEEQEVQLDQVYIEGAARAGPRLESLTVNGRPLLKKPSRFASFSYLARLEEGINTLTIEASDEAGGRAEKKLTFIRRLPHVRQLGSRLRVALLPFERSGQPAQVSWPVEEKVLGALLDRRRFDVVERRRLDDVLRELKLSESGVADEASALRLGKILAAGGLLLGSVSERERAVEMDLRLVDAETSLVVTSVDVYAEEVDAPKMRELCRGLVLKLCDELPVVEGTVLEVSRDSVLTDLGRADKVKTGMRCLVFQEGEPIRHPLSGTEIGARTEPLGHGLVRNVLEKSSELELMEGEAHSRVKPLHRVITQ